MTRDRTLVVHTGGIGDFLLACPAIAYLAQRGPVDVLGRSERIALAQTAGIVERAIDIDRSGFDSLLSEPSDRIRETLSAYGRVVVFMTDDDGMIEKNMTQCGVDEVRCFPGLPSATWDQHASAYYLDCVGAEAKAVPFRLDIEAQGQTHDVLIHPGSGGARKNWALDCFLELAKRLESRGRRLAWITGPAEQENPEMAALFATGREIVETPTLVSLAECLAGARQYIGNDSGVTHLAASVGCPVVAIFGVTDSTVWKPLGERVRVVERAGHSDAWVLECVLEALEDDFPQRR